MRTLIAEDANHFDDISSVYSLSVTQLPNKTLISLQSLIFSVQPSSRLIVVFSILQQKQTSNYSDARDGKSF